MTLGRRPLSEPVPRPGLGVRLGLPAAMGLVAAEASVDLLGDASGGPGSEGPGGEEQRTGSPFRPPGTPTAPGDAWRLSESPSDQGSGEPSYRTGTRSGGYWATLTCADEAPAGSAKRLQNSFVRPGAIFSVPTRTPASSVQAQ